MKNHPLNELAEIGPRTSLYTPPEYMNGQLIILCTWLGAARKHISKYIAIHQRIAPKARILLIESNVQILISSYKHQRMALQPAVDVILSTLAEAPMEYTPSIQPQVKLLLHLFSNGGTNTAGQLLLALHARLSASSTPLPIAGIVFDSCPARGTYWKSYDAMLLSLPRDRVSQFFGIFAVHTILLLLYTWIACGNENPASLQRRILVQQEMVQGRGGMFPPRVCYIYSHEDRMCDWRDVRDHASYVRDTGGWEVKEIVIHGSGHCAHLGKNEIEYNKGVEFVWYDIIESWDGDQVSIGQNKCSDSNTKSKL